MMIVCTKYILCSLRCIALCCFKCIAVESTESEVSASDESEFEESIVKSEDQKCIEEPPDILDIDKIIHEFKTATEYKFVYLVYAADKKSKFFSPYNFKIVLFKNIDTHCFFTLSNEGFMSHIEDEITFTPFAEFEDQYTSYKKIKNVS